VRATADRNFGIVNCNEHDRHRMPLQPARA
jgi:hypothetical protein